ncbi:hypothetical protein Nmel_012752, partial [Mimus melanotis]
PVPALTRQQHIPRELQRCHRGHQRYRLHLSRTNPATTSPQRSLAESHVPPPRPCLLANPAVPPPEHAEAPPVSPRFIGARRGPAPPPCAGKGHVRAAAFPALQLQVNPAVGLIHCPLARGSGPGSRLRPCKALHLLLELLLPPAVGVHVDPVVGDPLGALGDQAAPVQSEVIQLPHPACRVEPH